MHINDFISQYKNHPILFVGTGISLRYLKDSYTWDGLLKKITYELKGNAEYYLDLKSSCVENGKYRYDKIATLLEDEFTNLLAKDRLGKFQSVNDAFYKNMSEDIVVTRLKVYISMLLSATEIKEEKLEEITKLKKVCKNIGSVITTNYDNFIETLFEFDPLIGNGILLSNPYGSVYKIHGCISQPSKIIISEDDYNCFNNKFELIRAQLLSLFIHNPIVFLGYSIGDENIKSILKTIFTYVEPNSEDAKRIRDNFLLVEYEEDSTSQEICEHDIDLEGFSTIRINKIKTDDFGAIYEALARLELPVSAMDVRKVQSIVKEIYAGGEIKVSITEDLDSLKNSDKVIAIGSHVRRQLPCPVALPH
ncbi:SIR2 family protein [Acinetobacter sp.]|uniref:SIR2 family protein n=1 Tax=Acinetobacter sp. TaxID=472 RepID=UPI0024899534|nr:SIR2 family protein [Acinetobacter sp.]MDI1222346.1 SIR2 family protein [Acinetobacter sp.]